MLQKQKAALALTEELMQECEAWAECEVCTRVKNISLLPKGTGFLEVSFLLIVNRWLFIIKILFICLVRDENLGRTFMRRR